jgi:dolichol-phosphate mannosyltransferase
MDPRTLVIVPTYNERENLPALVKKIFSLPVKIDLLIVDDSSPDGTGQLADELAKQNPGMHVLHRAEKNGLGRAYIAGFKWALERDYEFIMEMDGDFSHNPEDIPSFIKTAVEQNADCVIGSRYSNGIRVINWPLKRLILSMGAGMYVRIITGLPLSDPTGGYKLFRRGALQSLDLEAVKSNGYSFQIELSHKLWRQGSKIAETPIIFLDRFHGSSKMSKKIVREALVMVWRLWIQNGFRRWPQVKRDAEKKSEDVKK